MRLCSVPVMQQGSLFDQKLLDNEETLLVLLITYITSSMFFGITPDLFSTPQVKSRHKELWYTY